MTLGETRDRKPEPYGVRGWLLFLCILLMVVTPIQIVAILIVTFQSMPATAVDSVVAFVPLALVLGIQGVGVVAGILLYREKQSGVRIAKVWCVLGVLFGLIAIAPDPVSAVMDTPLQTLQLVGIPGAWLAYLYRSERVRNTYGKNTVRHAAEVFR